MNIWQRLQFIFSKDYANKKLEETSKELLFQTHCKHCEISFKGFSDKFKCTYCEKYYCSKHRIPENHDCKGELKAPPGGFRETFEKGKTTAHGK